MAKLPRDTIIHYEHDGKGNINITITDLIRCKDCRHNGSFDTDCPISWPKEEDSYCSFAERRTYV